MDKKVKSFADRFEEFIMARVEDISNEIFHNPEYQQYYKKSDELYDQLKAVVGQEYSELLLEYDDERAYEKSFTVELAYKAGFRDGIKMLMEFPKFHWGCN